MTPITAEYDAKPTTQRADVLGTGDQPHGRITGAGLDRGDVDLGACADRSIFVLFEHECFHRSIRYKIAKVQGRTVRDARLAGGQVSSDTYARSLESVNR